MVEANIEQILSKNCFKYYRCPKENYYSFVIEDLEIVNSELLIEYVTVHIRYCCVYINFKDLTPEEPNFGLNFDVSGYSNNFCNKFINRSFDSENDFIEELQRLNSIGLNIKG